MIDLFKRPGAAGVSGAGMGRCLDKKLLPKLRLGAKPPPGGRRLDKHEVRGPGRGCRHDRTNG